MHVESYVLQVKLVYKRKYKCLTQKILWNRKSYKIQTINPIILNYHTNPDLDKDGGEG